MFDREDSRKQADEADKRASGLSKKDDGMYVPTLTNEQTLDLEDPEEKDEEYRSLIN